MFWILKRIFWLGVVAAVVYYGMNYEIGGRQIKSYAVEFYKAPIVQAAVKAGKDAAGELFRKTFKGDGKEDRKATPFDKISDEDRKKLEEVIKGVN